MTSAKALICSIIGPFGTSGEVLAEAVDQASTLLSSEGDLPIGFQWKRDLFRAMGEKSQKKPETLRKAATRTTHKVYDALQKDGGQMMEIIGAELKEMPSPASMMTYLAYYVRFEQPYFAFMRRRSRQKQKSGPPNRSDIDGCKETRNA